MKLYNSHPLSRQIARNLRNVIPVILFIPLLSLLACEPDSGNKSSSDSCAINHTGDWSFTNKLSEEIQVYIDPGTAKYRLITLKANQTKAVYDLKAGRHPWESGTNTGGLKQTGEIKVVECKNDTTAIQ